MFSTNSLQSFLAQLSVVCFFLAVNANAGLSQTSTATLTGIVQDSTGAVLPNVAVSVKNTYRNTTQFTRTNETGVYVLPALNPGNRKDLGGLCMRNRSTCKDPDSGASPHKSAHVQARILGEHRHRHRLQLSQDARLPGPCRRQPWCAHHFH